MPEKKVFDLSIQLKNTVVRVLYPTRTVYFNYYIKTNELGSKLIENVEDSKFYEKLKDKFYRSEKKSEILSHDAIYGERNAFNIVDVPIKK